MVKLLFGTDYEAAYGPISFILPGVIAFSVGKMFALDCSARGRPELNLIVSVCVLIVNVSLNIWWIPQQGILGAAKATSLSYILGTALQFLVYRLPLTSMRQRLE